MPSRRRVLALAGTAASVPAAGCVGSSPFDGAGTTPSAADRGNPPPWAREDSVVDVVVSVGRGGVTEGGTVTGVVHVADSTRRIDVGQTEHWTSGDLVGDGETPTVVLALDSGRRRRTEWTTAMGTDGYVVFVVTGERIRVRREGADHGETRTPDG